MLNITNIPSARVSFIDPRTGLMSREWYRFFLNLFVLTGSGTNAFSIEDILKAPTIQDQSGLFEDVYYQAQLASLMSSYDQVAQNIAAQNSQIDLSYIEKQIQSAILQPPQVEVQTLPYGSFYDTTTQNAAAINTAYSMTFNSSNSSSYSVARDTVNTSRIYVYTPGTYNFSFSAQMTKSSAALHYAYIWAAINGVDVPDSASRVSFQGSNSDTVPAWNFFLTMAANSYFELKWAVDDTGISIVNYAATAFSPAIPSVILTVNKVSL